jgi:dUTP pyrophosphatase
VSSSEIVVEVLRLAHGQGLELPSYQSAHAAGLDLRAAVPENAPVTLAAGAHALIPSGLSIALPPGYEAQVRPRSGLALKHGVTVLNSPGTVDADYRGEVGVLLVNLGHETFVINRGERIAQLVIAPVTMARLSVVTALSSTDRGAGGFGSTGR